ncbi:MAG: hypothetical protein JW896_07850 [Deltaproteobacteria bacterium]|nr:hypothetical protein [Deltaproteobacteria bacterium]
MNISKNQRRSGLVVPLMLFMVMGTTSPVMAEQTLNIDASRCVNIKSAIERLTCYDELVDQALNIDASPCVNIRSAVERLACYDELADQAQQSKSELEAADLSEPESDPGSNAPVVQRSPVEEQVPVTGQTISKTDRVTEENFGLPSEKREDENDLVELHSTISKVKEYVPGRYLITLENGQVWQQMVGERYELKVGYKVRIYPSRWGQSFRLSAEGVKGFIQVERVR